MALAVQDEGVIAKMAALRKSRPGIFDSLMTMTDILNRKAASYAGFADPHRNFRQCEAMGIPAWKGVLVRVGDKYSRLQQFALTDVDPLAASDGESIADTLLDLANYSLICLELYREVLTDLWIGSDNDAPEEAVIAAAVVARDGLARACEQLGDPAALPAYELRDALGNTFAPTARFAVPKAGQFYELMPGHVVRCVSDHGAHEARHQLVEPRAWRGWCEKARAVVPWIKDGDRRTPQAGERYLDDRGEVGVVEIRGKHPWADYCEDCGILPGWKPCILKPLAQ